jgi:hypothetical protein
MELIKLDKWLRVPLISTKYCLIILPNLTEQQDGTSDGDRRNWQKLKTEN